MQTVRSLIPGTLVGAWCGWMLCVLLFYWNAKADYWKRKTHYGYNPREWLTWPVAGGFWRWSAYLIVIGAAVGFAIGAVKLGLGH
jgi:hypothetical protein